MADNFTRRPGSPGLTGDNPAARGGIDDRPGRMDESARAREAMEEARQKAASLASEAKAEGKTVLGRQKDGAAEQVGSVASALRSAADDLQQRDPRAGRFVSYAAERLESFGRQVRDKDIDSLISDAERLGRRSPAAFFAGSVALGFLMSRFLKSSTHTETRHRSPSSDRLEGTASSRRDSDWREPADSGLARGPMNAAPGTSTPATSTSATNTPALLRPGGSLADRSDAPVATTSGAGSTPSTGGRNT